MKKTGSRTTKTSRQPKIHMCCDRILTGAEKIRAMELAIKESSVNRPPPHKPSRRRFGASSMGAPLKMALEAGKKWADGRTLGICFLDGSATQKARVKEQAIKWCKFANVKLNFDASKADAQIRISFVADDGSCSAAYRDAIAAVNAAGAVVVASAGNSTGHAVGTPANCPGVIAVGGLRHAGTKVGYSDLGPEISISAPAGNCINTAAGTPWISSSESSVLRPTAGTARSKCCCFLIPIAGIA